MYPRRPSDILVCLSVLGLVALVKLSNQESLCEVKSSGDAQALGGQFFIKGIHENIAVGGPLAHLAIGGAWPDINLTVTKPDDHFSFDPESRNISVVKKLWIRTEADKSREMIIGCTIVQRQAMIPIKITFWIDDVNNNAPVFDQTSYTASISEFSPVGSPVISALRATDADPDNSVVNYHIVPGNYSSYFKIPNSARGEIVLNKVLDYETIQVLKVAVAAVDNHPDTNVHFSSTISLTVHVIDEDDQNPRFRETLYEATVGESAPAGTTLAVSPAISAYDPDTLNASLRYSIMVESLSETNNVFDIDPVTAVMTLKEASTLTGGQVLSVLVKVTQKNNNDRYSSALVPVTVQAVNVHPPRFTNDRRVVSVMESSPVGTSLTTVAATDSDQGAALSYSLKMSGDATKFSIDTKTGLIKTTEQLDYETTTQYNLTVLVTDGVYTDSAVITVDVLDTNDNNPVFSQQEYVFRVSPAVKDNSLLGTVQVSDNDARTAFTFRILGNQTLFSINKGGEVKLSGDPAVVSKGSYELFVVVRDNGHPPRQDSAVIVVVANPVTEPVAKASNQEMNMVAIILLSVVCGCLLLIVAILVVYICKKQILPNYNDSCYGVRYIFILGGRRDPPANFVKSKSFEGDLNLNGDGYKSYYDDEAEGVACTPKSRHLAMYNDIPPDAENSTSPQENPFTGGDNPAYRSSITPRFMQGGVRGSCTYTARSSNSSGLRCSQISDTSMICRMAEVHQMDCNTSVAPTDEMDDVLGGSTANDSEPSLAGSADREIGSTQRLVSNQRARAMSRVNSRPNSRDSIATKSSSRSSNATRKVGSGSFGDQQHSTSRKQQQAVHPSMSVRPPAGGRPGITVYY